MSILTRFDGRFLVVAAFVGLAACDRGSSAYRYIKELPEAQWDSYASSLPIEQRLDLHKEIMERSGHNPTMTIRFSFSSKPDETYRAIVNRLKSGDRSRYYATVIYAIDGRNNFKICSQPDKGIIQDYLSGITGYSEQERYQPDFYSC